MNITILIQVLTVLALLPIWKWWWNAIAQKPSDTYAGENNIYSLMGVLSGIPTLLSIIAMFGMLIGEGSYHQSLWIPTAVVLYLGPFSFILAFSRAFGLGYTRLGKWLGVYPPSNEKEVSIKYGKARY